ncbi:MAG TPA: serine/threonine-protein kinase [Candidatus Limnocylindrales bacterium]|nr:serine/threonine-protein kinase [Candidatus Limnocylindrales bacterium]
MTTDEQTGQRFGLIAGRYQLRGQLGVGGMGRVWLAYDEMLGRDVAIKEVAPRQALSPEQSDELSRLILREARATARINHPHVVQIYDVIQTENWPWIVMEYIPSLSLHKVIQHEGPLPPGEVAVIGLALLEALNAAHEAGILHRDVKPDNVLIGEDGRVVLTDFGLAREADGRVTQTNRMGTPQYVAPERAMNGISSREADFWSLGATLYAAVEGRSPYQRKTMMETLTLLATQPPDPMARAGALEPVVMGLLRREPSERLTPQQLEAALKRVLDGGHSKADTGADTGADTKPDTKPAQRGRRHRRPRTGRRRALSALPAAMLALVLPAGVAGEPPAPPPRPEAGPTGVMACDTPLRTAKPLPPSAAAPTGRHDLMKGWIWYRDQSGFSVGVPAHWRYWRATDAVCFQDPSSSRILGIGDGPLEAPGFRLLFDNNVMLAEPALEREFVYGDDERSRHAVALVTSTLTVLWASDDFDFQPSRAFYDVVRATFQAYTSIS